MRKFVFILCLLGFSFGSFAKTATFEGVLKMYLVDNEGNTRVVSSYRQTDCKRICLAFVVELPRRINIVPYLDEGDDDFISDTYQSAIMVIPQFQYVGKDFAAKYANKRVRVSGNLYTPGAGWRNATDVVMNLRKIDLVK